VPQLFVNIGPVGNGALVSWYSRQPGIQPLLQLVVINVLRQRPAQGCLLEPEQIFGNRTSGYVAAFSDLAIADVTVKL